MRDFAMALLARKVSGAFEKRAPERNERNRNEQDNLALSTGLVIVNGHRKEI